MIRLAIAISVPFLIFVGTTHAVQAEALHRVSSPIVGSLHDVPVRVLIIGSSVADGWKDSVGGGYLKRAFTHFGLTHRTAFAWINRAVPGQGAMRLNAMVPRFIDQAKPQIVVIAWGGLDDAYDHTPLNIFREDIRQEISLSLAAHAMVFVITPPVSRASYTQFALQQPMYLDAEMQVARSFQNPNVYVFDVFDQMKRYLDKHHETYVPFMADGWHPNTRGHALASRLLLHDFKQYFFPTM